jgi:hypothetical protein
MQLDLLQIKQFSGDKLGTFDLPCPSCGPSRRSPVNRRRKVLRIWRLEERFATFHCARCGERGFARDGLTSPSNPIALAEAKAEAQAREKTSAANRMTKALWLWSQRVSMPNTPAETYLRTARSYTGPLPATLGFLPARGKHGPAMIAAFGLPDEPSPGELAIADDAVMGVHITRLAPDGFGKARTDADKIMVGSSIGSPIVLAPVNDLLGLAIAEGIEDTLSVHQATGLGAWAAGAASRLPALAEAVPSYIEAVTLMVDPDADGRRCSGQLAELLNNRGVEVRLILLSGTTQDVRHAA